jgi:enamine deaminase RidA (YjgF/YER057c/UK114 family)
MPIEIIQPPGLSRPDPYAHVAVATGRRTIYLAGQVAQDAHGNLVGVGDLAAQMAQAMENVALALEAAGATLDDIAKLTIYVVDWKPERMPALVDGLRRIGERRRVDPRRPTTLIGVASLFHPDLLIELDAVAVVG